MKNKIIISITIFFVLAVIGGVAIMLFSSKQPPKTKPSDVGKFDLTNYQWEIETFPSDKNVGQVDDANTAIEKSKEIWLDKYNEVNGQPYNPINGRKIEVSYDSKKECWHINGTLPPDVDGAAPNALIQKEGQVLAVWMG